MTRRHLTGLVLLLQLLATPVRAQSACPSMNVNDVLNDPRVQEALDQAWADSLEGTPEEREEGGYIQQCVNVNALTGERSYFTQVLRWPHGTFDSSSPSYPPRQTESCRTVATFHTHPGPESTAPDADGHENPIPSSADYMSAANDGLPGIIRWGTGDDTHDFTYNYGSVGDEPREPGWTCPQPPPKAHGHGDPHMLTLDGLPYDFMAIGDFILVGSPLEDLAIHARLEPYGEFASASVTTGIAVRNRRDRVEWRLEGRQLLVNGAPLSLAQGGSIRLRSYGVLRHDHEGYLLLSSGGDRLRVVFNTASVDYTFSAPRARMGTLRGLFGNFDGDPDNDLRSAGGEVATHDRADPHDHQRPLYRVFGESWRLTAETSVFATPFTAPAGVLVTTFPRAMPPSADAARSAASAACAAAGVTDPVVLDACVFDHMQAGDARFVSSSALADRERRDAVPLATGGEVTVDRDVRGRLEGGAREVVYPIALQAATYLFDGRGSSGTTWRLEAPDGSDSLAGMNLMAANPRRVTVAAGRYRLRVAVVPESSAASFRFRIRTSPVPEVSKLAPGMRVSGRIDVTGQTRVFELQLEPGRYTFVPTSDGALWWSLVGADGYERFDANQRVFMERAEGLTITTGGRYTLTVAGREWAGTGRYEVGFTRLAAGRVP